MRDLDCPSLSTLTTPELCEPDLAAHIASCATCRALTHLAAGAASPASSRAGCADIEMLLAARVSGGELGAADAARLDRHLSQCGGCAATFAALALDREGLAEIAGRPEREETRRVWSRAVEPTAARDALRRRRIATALGGATALSAVVAAIVLLVPARTERVLLLPASTEERVVLFPASTEERSAAAEPPTAEPTVEPTAVPAPASGPGPRRPHPVADPELDDEAELPDDAAGARRKAGEVMLEEAKQSAEVGDYKRSLERCEAALHLLPGDQRAIVTCAISACRTKKGDSASRYAAAVASENRRWQLRQICLQDGIKDLDAAKGPDRLETLLDDAMYSAEVGLYARTLRLARRVLAADPANQDALVACALASCRLKRRAEADRCMAGLGKEKKAAVAAACIDEDGEE